MAKKPLNEYNSREMAASAERRKRFLELISGSKDEPPLSVAGACRAIGIARSTVSAWRVNFPDFDADYRDAMEDSGDVLEDVAVNRAVKGTAKDVYYLGEVVGQQIEYDNGLLFNMIKGRKPEKYGGPALALQINNNQNAAPPTDDQLARALALVLAEAQAKGGLIGGS